jgi:hypothetical protein
MDGKRIRLSLRSDHLEHSKLFINVVLNQFILFFIILDVKLNREERHALDRLTLEPRKNNITC